MKTIRRISKSPAVVGIMVFTILLFSCGQETVAVKQEQISGRELMRAVYFLDGELINKIEPLSDLRLENVFDANMVTEMRTHIDDLLSKIEASHPGTFAAFKRDIISGDHLIISQSISRN